MCSKDVTQVYSQIQIGQLVRIIPDSLPKLPQFKGNPASPASPCTSTRVIFTADAPNGVPANSATGANTTTPGKSTPARKRVSLASNSSGHGA